MVLRLIGWHQNGQQQPSTELAFKPAPLPRFDGITLPTGGGAPAAASPTTGAYPQNALQPQLSGQSTGGGPIRVPPLDPAKVQQYSGLFDRSGVQNGFLDGGTAKSIFERAGLPNEVLGKIWTLSDREQRGALDQTEFIVAMHLLTSMKTHTMTALPNTLPPGLYEAAARRGARPPSRQLTGQGGTPIPRQFTGSSIGAPPRTQSPLARPPGYSTPPPQSAQTTGTPWLVTQQEKAQYDRFFATIDTSGNGVITGEQAVRFFSDSRLPEDTLATIWDLADIHSEGQLNRDEFAVAMYLIRQQRAPNPPALPAFLPAALIPPSMRGQQQSQQSTAPAFDNANNTSNLPKSASEDLFGLDSSPTQTQAPRQLSLQPQTTGMSASRDPFGGSQPASPGSPQRFQSQSQLQPQPSGGGLFKPFIPSSAFGTSLQSQTTGTSTTSSQGQARGFAPQQQQGPKAPMPSAMDDLLGDNDAHAEESRNLTNETTELANMSNQIGNLRTQMESTQNKKQATQADLASTSTQKQQLEQRLQQFRAQYETEVRAVKEMEQQLAASRDSTKKLNQELAMLEGTFQDLQTQHNTIGQQLQTDQQENASLKQKLSQINADVSRLKPEIEKMKLDARQQKGLVSINKKQLTTTEGERDRLQSEKTDLEREAAERARSPEPAPITRQASNIASPAASTMSSTNPFFRKASESGIGSVVTSPTRELPPPPGGPTPSAFDAIFGPSEAFAPKGQTVSRTGTPPATSFIGRSMGAAAVGAVGAGAAAALADSTSSAGEHTPDATPPSSERALGDTPASASAEPPPPPESRQFTPTNLPLGGGVMGGGDDDASSTRVMPPASWAGEAETPPREDVASPAPGSFDQPPPAEREIVPGAFPDEELQPTTSAQEVIPSKEPSPQPTSPAPAPKPADDFDSAFASFGPPEPSKVAQADEDPFAPSSSQQPAASQSRGFGGEFPPIESLEHDDEDDSSESEDDEPERGGFDDDFAAGSPGRNDASAASHASLQPTSAAVASGNDIAAARPAVTSIESTASDLPTIDTQTSPPSYEQSGSLAHGGSGERTASNQFPPEFGDLLPSREDPTSPPPPSTSPPLQQSMMEFPDDDDITPAAPQPQQSSPPPRTDSRQPPPNFTMSQPGSAATSQSLATPSTDVFHDAFSRPISSFTPAPEESPAQAQPAPAAPKNAFDDFDDFGDLHEAKEADHSNDFAFGSSQSADEGFNPAFDSPGHSTPMARSVQQSQDSNGNGFANFTPNVSTSSTSPFGGGSGGGSLQQTPQNVQHDWDAIFSGLDNNKELDTSFANESDPWGAAPSAPATATATALTNGYAVPSSAASTSGGPGGKSQMPELGRAITPGTEHDDPILKRLTGMGYSRGDALNALEMFDYDINKVS